MEYVIGAVQKGKSCRIILKTKNVVHTNLEGRVTLEQVLGNTTVRDTFTVLKKFQIADTPEAAYDWYYIADHYSFEDRSNEVRAEAEQQITDLEIETIEQDLAITDNEIAIMELQEQIEELTNKED